MYGYGYPGYYNSGYNYGNSEGGIGWIWIIIIVFIIFFLFWGFGGNNSSWGGNPNNCH